MKDNRATKEKNDTKPSQSRYLNMATKRVFSPTESNQGAMNTISHPDV